MNAAPLELTDSLEALDWDEDRACEHPHHAEDDSHDGPATHWAMSTHACHGPVGIPYPVCGPYARYVEATPGPGACLWCSAEDVSRWLIGRIS